MSPGIVVGADVGAVVGWVMTGGVLVVVPSISQAVTPTTIAITMAAAAA
jgi:hypothetical protein